MGTIFKYIADNALQLSYLTKCHHCGCEDKPLYDYYGEIVNPDLAEDPQLAREEPEVEVLCADCILGGNVRRKNAYVVEKIVDRFAKDKDYTWQEFHKLLDIPYFSQGFDWPMCCGEWCEFTGSPEDFDELLRIQSECQFWNRGLDSDEWKRDFQDEGRPESYDEISVFLCHSCGKKYYIDQYT